MPIRAVSSGCGLSQRARASAAAAPHGPNRPDDRSDPGSVLRQGRIWRFAHFLHGWRGFLKPAQFPVVESVLQRRLHDAEIGREVEVARSEERMVAYVHDFLARVARLSRGP